MSAPLSRPSLKSSLVSSRTSLRWKTVSSKSELLVAIRDAYRAMDELKKRLVEVEALHDDLIA